MSSVCIYISFVVHASSRLALGVDCVVSLFPWRYEVSLQRKQGCMVSHEPTSMASCSCSNGAARVTRSGTPASFDPVFFNLDDVCMYPFVTIAVLGFPVLSPGVRGSRCCTVIDWGQVQDLMLCWGGASSTQEVEATRWPRSPVRPCLPRFVFPAAHRFGSTPSSSKNRYARQT